MKPRASQRGWRIAIRAALALGVAATPCEASDGPTPEVPGADSPARRVRVLMGAPCSVTVYADSAGSAARSVAAAFDAIARMEELLSTYRPDSALSRVNRLAGRGPVPIPSELGAFLHTTLRLARLTDGAFDPTVGSLVDVWDLRGSGRIPSGPELERARRAVGYRNVRLEAGRTMVQYADAHLWIDPGGIGKGYALDRAAEVLRRHGVGAALLDFGGQLLALGAPPGEDVWQVAVADPTDRDRPAIVLGLRDASAATSAQSERGRDAAGRWLGHILDPRTGVPVERDGSVTVIAPSAAEADALATALFVMGAERGLAWAAGDERNAVGYLVPCGRKARGAALAARATERFHSAVRASRSDVRWEEPSAARARSGGAGG